LKTGIDPYGSGGKSNEEKSKFYTVDLSSRTNFVDKSPEKLKTQIKVPINLAHFPPYTPKKEKKQNESRSK